MLSAQQIYATAPLGSLLRFSSGEPRPSERFTRKLRAWKNDNGTGRLVERHGEYLGKMTRHAPTFTLHLGDFGAEGTIVLSVRQTFSTEGAKQFEILETPKPGMVRVLTSFDDRDELRHLAPDMASAERWMAMNRYSNMRAEIVPDPDPVIPPVARRQAA